MASPRHLPCISPVSRLYLGELWKAHAVSLEALVATLEADAMELSEGFEEGQVGRAAVEAECDALRTELAEAHETLRSSAAQVPSTHPFPSL